MDLVKETTKAGFEDAKRLSKKLMRNESAVDFELNRNVVSS